MAGATSGTIGGLALDSTLALDLSMSSRNVIFSGVFASFLASDGLSSSVSETASDGTGFSLENTQPREISLNFRNPRFA